LSPSGEERRGGEVSEQLLCPMSLSTKGKVLTSWKWDKGGCEWGLVNFSLGSLLGGIECKGGYGDGLDLRSSGVGLCKGECPSEGTPLMLVEVEG
jgi:hypothetical protein